MNYRMIARILGYVLLAEAVLLLLPLLVAALYGESVLPFLFTAVLCAAAGGALFLNTQKNKVFYAREGFFVVSAGWVALSLLGALPFVIDGCIPSFVDAFFETVSGFTTTGATILGNVEALPYGMLFWRSFTHWIGGMGVLVFIMAVLPLSNEHSMHVMRAEVPGPVVGKLVPRTHQTAMWLYAIYLLLTLLQTVLLLCGGMSLFDSLTHAFATAGTGGFSVKNAGIAGYGSDYLTMVVGVFMLIFGINFNLYFLMMMRHFRQALRNRELYLYLGMVGGAVLVITLLVLPQYGMDLWSSFRDTFFHVSSLITSTGFVNTDYDLWPSLAKTILLFLMVVGACAGSTGGGLKVARLMIVTKKTLRDLRQMISPRSVSAVKMEGKRVEESTLAGVGTFCIVYVGLLVASTLLLSCTGMDLETNLSASIACISNVGPAFGALGPTESYAVLPVWGKLWLALLMLLGRLEIFPLLLCFTPSLYRRGKS